jgi:ribosome-associated protein
LALAAAAAAAGRKAEDVVMLSLEGVASYCDAFVVCSGSNRRQVRAIAEGVLDDLRKRGVRPIGVEGMETSRWVLIDFGDVIVHVFDGPMRGFYDLEGLWAEAPRVAVPSEAPAADYSVS